MTLTFLDLVALAIAVAIGIRIGCSPKRLFPDGQHWAFWFFGHTRMQHHVCHRCLLYGDSRDRWCATFWSQ